MWEDYLPTITKIIVERLKNVMPKLVSPFQSGFILGRSIQKNIHVAREIVHCMKNLKGKKGFFVIKVDLSKAYDKISWDFIWRNLVEINLHMKIINIIMHGVTSVETNIKWNGSTSEYFVLYLDKRPHLISQVVQDGNWRTI